ncbi:MAG: Bug family tripartite tricarboxylate transporter substrate binding protein [Alphaproteobacteria bacterium]
MKPYRLILSAAILGLAFGVAHDAAAQQSVADFYKGKTFRIVVGSSESSGVDILARVAARHLPKHMEGKPTIIVQNMPQPESIAAANHIYNVAEKDGLTIGAGSSGLFSRAISQPNIRFDLDKFTWIANLYTATVLYWMRTDFPCQTIEQLAKCPQPIKFGATARGSTGYGLVPEMLKDAFKLNMDMIYGYRNNDIEIAIERNEIHASGGDLIGFLGGRGKQLLDEGKVKILLQVSGQKAPALAKYDVPWVMDVIPDAYRPLFTMVNPILDLARSYFAPPGIPADRAEALRDAFAKTVADPEFVAETKKVASIEPILTRGEDMQRAIIAMLDQPPEVKDKVVGLLTSK